MSLRYRARLLAGGLLVSAACSVASAQEVQGDRPFRGLFGASAGDRKEHGQSLAFDWSVLGAYDDNLAADTSSGLDPQTVVNGMYGAVSTGLTYTAHGRHRTFSATGTSTGRYYPDLSSLSAFEGGGGVSFGADFGRRTRVDLGQFFLYQPYYGINFLNVVPSEASPLEAGSQTSDLALSSHSSYGLNGRYGLSQTIGARSSIRADYSYRSVQFADSNDNFNWRVANVSFSRNLTRNASLHVGYGYGTGNNTVPTGAPSVVNHNLDLGIDYNRQLSFSRRTRVSFSSGSTAVTDQGSIKYRLIGTATLTQEIGRSWHADTSYNRGVQYLPGFGEMFFADTVQVRVGGLLARRIEAGAAGGYSTGQVGFATADSSYSSGTASGDLRIAMSRNLSFFTQYTYYRYGFGSAVQVPFNLAAQQDRQAIRIGISGWLPIVR